MGLFSRDSFLGSCFRGWGSSNIGVQTAGALVGTCILGFVALWYIIKWCIRLFEKHQEKKAVSTPKVTITLEDGIPNFNSGNIVLRLESVNDEEVLARQLSRVNGYTPEMVQKIINSCPVDIMKGFSIEDAKDMQTLLQLNDCCVVSII